MALNVTGGPLEFDAKIDFDLAGLQSDMGKAATIIKTVLAKALEPKQLDIFSKSLDKIPKQLDLFASGLGKLGSDQLDELKAKVDGTNDEFQKLKITTEFIEKNLDKLDLSPEEFTKLKAAIATVKEGFNQMGDSELTPLTRLRQIRNELTQLSITQGAAAQGSPQFQKLLAEATQIEHEMRNVNRALALTSEEAPGLAALGQGFRGLVGGVEAAAGTMGLFNDNEEETAKITKNLIAIQTIFNGVQEITTILSKNSSLNMFLESKFRSANATAALEESIALRASNIAKEQGIAITEATVIAQKELNVAMSSNPVGIILVSIVALFGAYELLSKSIFKASDATQQHKAAVEAYNEASKKAAETIGEEEGHLEALVVLAKNDAIARSKRVAAMTELNQKYPQTLANLRLETLYTNETTEALKRTTEEIKKKAQVAAAEDVYKDRLKAVAKAQAAFNDEVENGSNFFKELWASATSTQGLDGRMELIKRRLDDITEATNKSKGAWEAYIKSISESGSPIDSVLNHINDQIEQIISVQAKRNDPTFNAKTLKFFEDEKKRLQEINHIITDPATKSQDDAIIALYQRRVEAAKKGTAEELQARLNLAKKEQEVALKDKTLFDDQGQILSGISPENVKKALDILGGFQSKLNDLGEEFSARSLKNMTAAAQAIVLALETAGEQGSQKFFEAQRKAIIAAAHEQIVQAKDNAGERFKLEEQLALDLHNLDLQEKTQQLENQKSILNARLSLVKEGSDEELKLRLALIDDAAQEEILQAGQNQDKIREINAKTAKEKAELEKKFSIEGNETFLNIILSGIETRLTAVKKGTKEELQLKKEELQLEAALNVDKARIEIKNETLLQAKIKEIRAKSLLDQRKLEDDFFKLLLDRQLNAIQKQADLVTAELQTVIDSPVASLKAKQNAAAQIIQTNIAALKRQITEIQISLFSGQGDATELQNKIDELEVKLKKLQGDALNLTTKNQLDRLKDFAAVVGAIGQGLGTMSDDLKDVNSDLAEFIKGLSSAANIASNAISAFASFASGDIAGGIGSAVNALSSIINNITAVGASRKKAEQDILDFQAKVLAGEEQYNEMLRDRERQQVLLNKLTLQGLADQKALLDQQKSANTQAFNDTLAQIQKLTFVAGEKGKKGSLLLQILGGPLDLFGAQKTKVAEELQSLAGKTFDELQKLFDSGQLVGQAKELFEQLQKIKQEGVDIDAVLAENAEKFKEAFTGTTASSITDAIVDGFAQGKHSAADFAGTFTDLMRQALISTLKFKYLEGPLKDFFDQFAAASESDSTLSDTEIATLQDTFNKIIANADKKFADLQKIAGLNLSSQSTQQQNTLTGAFKTMSEDTGNLLAGQFAGQRIATIEIREIQRSALQNLNNIELNTANTVLELKGLLGLLTDVTLGAKALTIK